MTYNGYSNYETWSVCLWLSNDEATYRHCRDLARQCRAEASTSAQFQHGVWTEELAALSLLADLLKEYVESQNPLAEGSTLFTDLLAAALSEVDWYEVAAAFLEE